MSNNWVGIERRKPENLGFIYVITHKENGKYYCGKKQLLSNKSRKPLKGKKNKRHYQTESDWKDYWGSSNEFLKYVEKEGKDKFSRQIIMFCNTKFDLAYQELYYQMGRNVLYDKNSFNEIINIRLRRRK